MLTTVVILSFATQEDAQTFDFAMKTKVRWSKNVHEEQRCPDQILLASMDTKTCVIFNLAIYLEDFLSQHPGAVLLFTEQPPGPKTTKNLINRYRGRIKMEVWSHEDFKRLADEDDEDGIGTHSYRKYPSTYARQNGCTPDEIEIRGRWKHQGKRVVFRYIDVKQLFIDAKVAAALCIGGPIKYDLVDDAEVRTAITNDWLFTNVIPCIRARFSNDSRLCRVLGLALLFGCLDEEIAPELPLHVEARVWNAWEALQLRAEGANINPVHRVPLHVYRINDTLCIDPVVLREEGAGATGATVVTDGTGGGNSQQQRDNDSYQAVLIQLQQQKQQMTGMEQRIDGSLNSFRTWTRNQFTTVNNSIRRFGGTIQGGLARQDPAQAQERQAAANQEQADDAMENGIGGFVSLSRAPKLCMSCTLNGSSE